MAQGTGPLCSLPAQPASQRPLCLDRPNVAKYGSWLWNASWPGWFVEAGHCESKQEAADAATEAWWRLVNTEIPRNVDFEVAMIVARLLVRPVPNSVFGEEPEFLRKVLWNIQNVYADEIKRGMLPPPVKNLMEQVSAEISRRRATGEIPEEPTSGFAESGGYRRRRRHR